MVMFPISSAEVVVAASLFYRTGVVRLYYLAASRTADLVLHLRAKVAEP